MRNSTSDRPQPALLFIPDISGFTRFVTDTEISHSKHIIEELLEVLMDANELEMEVSEIEGDAILFYRFGPAPEAASLLGQIREMFVRFHTHLRKYETHRICHCGACKTARSLSLKFVAHYGDVTLNTIKSFRKLFGKEVIVVHRLLKNSIAHHEYLLITGPLMEACPDREEIERLAWEPVQHAAEVYDSGEIRYSFLSLMPLWELLPELLPEDYSIPGVKTSVLHCKGRIEAPMDLVFNIYADLPLRSKWIAGALEEVDHLNHKIFQAGATHHCLADVPVIVSHDFETSEQIITFTETDADKLMCAVYTLRKINDRQTEVEVEWFMKRHLLRQLFFRLFTKQKLRRGVEASIGNLNACCKALLESGDIPTAKMILSDPAR